MTRSTLLVFVTVLASQTMAFAQAATEGSIHGYVRDAQSAIVRGVTITATSDVVPGSHTTVAAADGYYRLLHLQPGSYSIRAQAPGFATFSCENVVVRAGLTLGLEITMQPAGFVETVQVTAQTPMLDVASAGKTTNVSGRFQRTVPLAGRRDWADFMLVIPGVVSEDSHRSGSYFVHGANFSSNVYQIDGGDFASVAQSFNTYMALNTDAIEDVHVKTAGLDASAPLGLGAVVNVTTMSGTNLLHGAAGVAYQSQRWNASNTPGGTSTRLGLFQPDLSVGGPLHRDRLWFFGAYRRLERVIGITRSAKQIALLRSLAPSFRPFDDATRANYGFLKVTARPALNHQLSSFWQYDVTPNDANGPTFADKFQRSVQGGRAYGARLTSIWTPTITTKMAASYNDKNIWWYVARNDVPGRQVHQNVYRSAGQLVGTGVLATLDNLPANGNADPNDKLTVTADATYYRQGGFGSHELQTGIHLQPRSRLRSMFTYANGGFVLENVVLRDPANPAAGFVPFHRRTYGATEVPSRFADESDVALYVQDAWRPMSRLTVTAGVRLDWVRRTDRLFSVKTQDSREVGPRVGVNYALTADGRNAVRASWARSHELLSQNRVLAGSQRAEVRDAYDLDLDGTFDTVFVTPAATALAPDRVFDLERWHQPYVNEWLVAFSRQTPGQVILDASFLRREYRDRGAGLEINGKYDSGVFSGYHNGALNQVYLVTNNIWNWPVYSAVEFAITKHTQDVQLIGSYMRQFQHLAGSWQPNDPASILQPGAFPNNRGIGDVSGSPGSGTDANSLSGTHQTRARQWRDHVVRLGAFYSGPWRLLLATNYVFQSGLWSGPIVTLLNAPDPAHGPPTVRLSNGRLVSNPLATTLRFAFPTRGEGQFNFDSVQIWNVRIGRQIPVKGKRLEAALDVFNLTNGDADQFPETGSNQPFSPNYGKATRRQLPRSAQISLRLEF